MSCAEIRPLLAHRPLDLLEDDELGGLDAHLDACAACATYLDALDAAYADLEGDPIAAALPESLWAGITQRLAEDEAEPEPVHDDASAGAALAIAVVCTYCHDALTRPESRYCASCLAPHHADCFRAHGSCAAPGCDETHVVQATLAVAPAPARGRRRVSRRLSTYLAIVGAAVVGAGTLAAVRWTRARTAAELDAMAMAVAADEAARSDAIRAERERKRQEMLAQERAARDRVRQLRLQQAEDEARQLAEQARRAIRGRRVYLGARFESIPANERRTGERELQVVDLRNGSIAKQAGLKVGDRLLAVDGKPVRSLASLGAALRGVGANFTLQVGSFVREAPQRVLRVYAPPAKAGLPFEGSIRTRPRLRFDDGKSWLDVYADGDLTNKTFEVVLVTHDAFSGKLKTKHLGYITCRERLDRDDGWDLPPEWRVKGGWIANHADQGLWLRGPVQTDAAALLRSALRLNVDVEKRHEQLLRFVELEKAKTAFESAIAVRAFPGRELAIEMLVELWEERGEGPPPAKMLRLLERARSDDDPSVAAAAKRALKRLRAKTKKAPETTPPTKTR